MQMLIEIKIYPLWHSVYVLVAGDLQDTGQIPVGSVQNAYVQMLNRGSGAKPASSDGQAQMLRDIPVTGQIR